MRIVCCTWPSVHLCGRPPAVCNTSLSSAVQSIRRTLASGVAFNSDVIVDHSRTQCNFVKLILDMSYFAAAPMDASYFMGSTRPTYQQQHDPVFLHPLLCVEPNAPCHFLKLPTELRQEIFKYLMPEQPIEQRSLVRPTVKSQQLYFQEGSWRSTRATPLLNLLLGFNREIYHEVKDVLYATATFIIHVGRDGVEFCK